MTAATVVRGGHILNIGRRRRDPGRRVNAHTHLSEAPLPGMGEDLSLFECLGQWAGTYHEKVAAARTRSSPGVDHSSTTRMPELGRYQTRWR